jgi:hypothetical protein
MEVHVVENLRPRHDVENLGPARETIHELFMNHVMAQAPGYGELMDWVDVTIMPTPGAVGRIIGVMAEQYHANIIGVDIGGATTDVFSSFGGLFNRTVSANLGMSYSICNVLEEAGFPNILRWVPFGVDEEQCSDWIANKMVRPTVIPHAMRNLILEQAIAREALRLSFAHHKSLAKKVEKEEISAGWRTQQKMFVSAGQEIIQMMGLDMLVGSGGALSHAPRREQATMMLIDSFQPEGITELCVDSIFMMPHLGVLSTTHPEIAAEVFDKDCLVRLGTVIAPSGKARDGQPVATVKIWHPTGLITEKVAYGSLKRIPLGIGETAEVAIDPAPAFDMGQGKGKRVRGTANGGLVGIVIDARGRPLELPEDPRERVRKLSEWLVALNVYPEEALKRYQAEFPIAAASPVKGGQAQGGGVFGRLWKK